MQCEALLGENELQDARGVLDLSDSAPYLVNDNNSPVVSIWAVQGILCNNELVMVFRGSRSPHTICKAPTMHTGPTEGTKYDAVTVKTSRQVLELIFPWPSPKPPPLVTLSPGPKEHHARPAHVEWTEARPGQACLSPTTDLSAPCWT